MTEPTEVQRIGDQLERAFEGDAWHGTPILSLLSDITVSQATSRPILDGHSVWEILDHMTAWLSIARRRVGGEPIHEITDEMDWPTPKDPTAVEWREARRCFHAAYVALRASLERLSDTDLGNRVEGKMREYSVYEDLHGVIQHSLYHAGQIALLSKAAGEAPPDSV